MCELFLRPVAFLPKLSYAFAELFSDYGLTLGKTVGMREITSPAHAAKIMALVSRR
jgi:hypothetical protein